MPYRCILANNCYDQNSYLSAILASSVGYNSSNNDLSVSNDSSRDGSVSSKSAKNGVLSSELCPKRTSLSENSEELARLDLDGEEPAEEPFDDLGESTDTAGDFIFDWVSI